MERAMSGPDEKSIKTLGWFFHGTGLVCVAASLAAYGWFVLKPLTEHEQLCQQRIYQLEEMLAKSPKVRQENRAFNAELASLRHTVEETQRRLPAELRENEFVDQVRQVAAKAGMEMGDHQLGLITALESYSQAELTFNCKGSYASICQFLDEIDHFARITEISSLRIESDDNFRTYPIQVTFVLYFGGATHDRSMKGDVL
jgi:Tfp pilus assembly protein PilO